MKKKPKINNVKGVQKLIKALEAGSYNSNSSKIDRIYGMDELDDMMVAGFVDGLALKCYQNAKNKGFHEGETIGVVSLERLAIFIANLHGECSELWEAARKGKLMEPCDKDPSLCNLEEELADIIIRAFDTAKSYGVNIGEAILKKHKYNQSRPFMHGKRC